MDDGQSDDEQADADEDLDAAFLSLVADPAGCRQQEHERERVEAIHQPVGLTLRQREDEGDGTEHRDDRWCRRDEGDKQGGRDAERRADRLLADTLAPADEDVQDQDEYRLRDPVGLGPAQHHADRRADAEDDSERDRHHAGDGQGEAIACGDLWGAEPARDDDAVERRDREDHSVDRGVGHRVDGRDERGREGEHQQGAEPPEPDPCPSDDRDGGQESHPPPVIRGVRADRSRHPECGSDIQHAVSAAELRSGHAEQQPDEHGGDPELPDECADHERGQDQENQDRDNDLQQSPCPGRLRARPIGAGPSAVSGWSSRRAPSRSFANLLPRTGPART